MKVNVSLELDDAARDLIANYFDGRVTKRMATRRDIRAFVEGCVDMAIQNAMGGGLQVHQACALSVKEADEVQRLRALGKDDSYIRGWIQVMRRRS